MTNIQKSLKLARSLNYKPTLALDLLNMGYCLTYKGDYKEAEDQLSEAEKYLLSLMIIMVMQRCSMQKDTYLQRHDSIMMQQKTIWQVLI